MLVLSNSRVVVVDAASTTGVDYLREKSLWLHVVWRSIFGLGRIVYQQSSIRVLQRAAGSLMFAASFANCMRCGSE